MNLYWVKPEEFIPRFQAAGCLCEYGERFLLVKRHPEKPYGNTWALPGGKLEKGEEPRQAVVREVYEEIGLKIDDETLKEAGSLFVKHPNSDYVFHIFRKRFSEKPLLILNEKEHLEGNWFTLKEARILPLIVGAEEMFDYLFSKAQS